ncbi:MAG: HRDC domain-containing protein [Pseudomonadota bacterium]
MVFFRVPAMASGSHADELNAFLASHPLATVDRQWVEDGVNSFWAVCCTVPGEVKAAADAVQPSRTAPRNAIDYQQVLSPGHFSRFAGLRAWRKQVAKAENVQAYAIFTNEQLADIAQLESPDRVALSAVDGVGEKRMERYANAVLAVLGELDA